jgi:hypothetical protein
MDVDRALDSLCQALDGAGVERPSPPAALTALEELEAAIDPMRLPADVRRFWQRVDAATLGAMTYPELHGPDLALTSWRMGRAEFAAGQPAALLQVAYSSHQCMSVELDVGEIQGGALFEWNLVDGGFERRFNGVGEWLTYIARLIDSGWFESGDAIGLGRRLLVPDRDRDSEERATRPVPAPHPVHGTTIHIGRDILDWPEHWQRAAGLRPEDLSPRGATHTVAAVLASPAGQRLRATIAARVVGLMGTSGWTRVRVDDGTAALDVVCPAATTLLGPRMGDRFEFDIIVEPGATTGATAEAIRRLPASR